MGQPGLEGQVPAREPQVRWRRPHEGAEVCTWRVQHEWKGKGKPDALAAVHRILLPRHDGWRGLCVGGVEDEESRDLGAADGGSLSADFLTGARPLKPTQGSCREGLALLLHCPVLCPPTGALFRWLVSGLPCPVSLFPP